MTKLLRNFLSLVALAIFFAGLVSPAFACIGQVTGVSSTAVVIVVPGTYAKVILIQNNGSGAVRLSIDGGTTYTDQQTGKTGANPTASTGILLPAGSQIMISTVPSASGIHRPIVAILVSGSTTLDIVTDDSPGSNASTTFPTS